MSASAKAVDVAPFDLGEGEGGAVLCLHGLTGTPFEVRPFGEALARRGLRARGPVLPGHDASLEELARFGHEAWLEAARAEYRALRERHAWVSVAGLSLGGLLGLALAAEEPLDALAVVATPLRLRGLGPHVVRWARHFVHSLPKRDGSDIRDPVARSRHPSRTAMPLASVHELRRLQRRVRRSLERVKAPLFVAHGLHDRTASPDDARDLIAAVGASQRELLWLADSAHVVPVDHDGPRLSEALAEHFARLSGSPATFRPGLDGPPGVPTVG